MSYNDYLTGELGALSDDRTSIDWDNGDRLRWLGNALIGRGAEFSREGVRSRAKTEQEKNVNQSLATDRRQITDLLAGTGIDTSNLTLGGNRTAADLKAEMGSLLTTGQAAQQYAAMPGANLSDIRSGSTLSSITQLAQGLKKSNKEEAEGKVERKETAALEYAKSRDRERDRRYDVESERMWNDKKEGRLNRAQEMRINAENNAMQMQLEYSRLAQADATRSQDRKDKAIMALLGGLGNLGAGFTI